MRYQITIRRVDAGARNESTFSSAMNYQEVSKQLAGKDIIVYSPELTENQIRGICAYMRAADLGYDTAEVDVAAQNRLA